MTTTLEARILKKFERHFSLSPVPELRIHDVQYTTDSSHDDHNVIHVDEALFYRAAKHK